jgi:subtilisin family serine protease
MLPLWIALAGAAPVPDGEPAAGVASTTLLRDARHAGAAPIRVVVQAAPKVELAALVRRIAAIPDAEVEAASSGFVQVVIPGDRLGALAAIPGVARVRHPYYARTKEAAKSRFTSEGVDLTGAEGWHALGLRGDGRRVAILDVGFSKLNRRFGGQLPPRRDVDRNFDGAYRFTTHGTAVAEVVHDMAPGASLALYDFQTDVQFFEACDRMLANGETIVNASIGFDNLWHADGTSPWTRKVDELAAAGVLWIAAAGNEADIYWVGTPTDADGDGWLELGGTENLPIEAWEGDVEVRLRWDEPMGGASMDIDLYVGADTDAEAYDCGAGIDTQQGAEDPLEVVRCTTPDGDRTSVSIKDLSGRAVAEGVTLFVYVASGRLDPAYRTLERSLTLPGDAAGAISVGAFDVSAGELAWYSSHGPTDDGRLKPDLVAPSHVVTKSERPFVFTGTSAAAPHVAGAAALVAQAHGGADAETIRAFLLANTRDEGPQGPDPAWGAGMLTLGEPPAGWEAHAVEAGGCGCASSPTSGAVPGLLLGLLALTRRLRRG